MALNSFKGQLFVKDASIDPSLAVYEKYLPENLSTYPPLYQIELNKISEIDSRVKILTDKIANATANNNKTEADILSIEKLKLLKKKESLIAINETPIIYGNKIGQKKPIDDISSFESHRMGTFESKVIDVYSAPKKEPETPTTSEPEPTNP